MESAAAGDGVRVGHGLLAASDGVAARRGLAATPRGAARRTAAARPAGSRTGGGRQRVDPCVARGKKTGPNPTDRRKAGSKHHLLTEAHGIPLVAHVTAANRNDITVLLDLVDAIPPLRGRPGRPLRRPAAVQGDRGYDSHQHRAALVARGITPVLARRYTAHGSGLGKTRWVVERTLAWLHRYRRLAVRYERLDYVHEAFLTLGCALICWNFLKVVI
jgi:transposase